MKSILIITLLAVVASAGLSGLAHAAHFDHNHEDLTISPQKDIYSTYDKLTLTLMPDRIENQESDYVIFSIREDTSTSGIAAVISNHAINGTFTASITLSEHGEFRAYDGSENMYVHVRYDGKEYRQSFKLEHPPDPQIEVLQSIVDTLQKQNKILSTLYTNFWNQALAVGDKKGYDRGYSEGVAAGMASCLN